MLHVQICAGLVLVVGIIWGIKSRNMTVRIRDLERELQQVSDMMTQMAEVQIQSFQKYSASFEALEERIMELSLPSQDTSSPLERRHQVLALSRQGVALKEIVKRLKAPAGEAEVILNLQKYMAGDPSRSLTAEQVRTHV
ncbi:MAG TPA: hypothetical protein VMG30_01860 [Acidobacteriota bacterium]|nr:hypothetical protein [Acidobacteriota bacterium]